MGNENFKMIEESGNPKQVYTIHGGKGTGKTTFAFRFSGIKYCIGFDHKALRIKQNQYNNSSDIRVFDGLKYYIRTAADMTKSAKMSHEYILWLLDEIERKEDCDWIVLDNLARLHEICEMCMRDDYKLNPFQAFANLSYWKMRRVYLQRIHSRALEVAKKGVIYTVISKIDDILIEDGQTIERKEVPQYVDVVEEETDTLFQTRISQSKDNTRFIARVITSKIPKYKTGSVLDVTLKPKGE